MIKRALFSAVLALTGGFAVAGEIAVNPLNATAPTTGGPTAPANIQVTYTAAGGDTTNNFTATLFYETAKLNVVSAGGGGASCSVDDALGEITILSNNLDATPLPSGVMCNLTFTSVNGAPAGPSPLNLDASAPGQGCLEFLPPNPVACTFTDGNILISAGTFNYAATPATLTYNGVVGAATPTQNVNIAAQGGNTNPVTFSGCSFAGANAGDFAMSPAPTFPLNVAAGANVNIPIAFTAGALGARTATFSCATANGTAVGGSFPITLNGTGVTNTLTTTPTITFPNTLVGSPAAGQNVVATAGAGNTGNVTITSCAIGGANAGDFSQTPAVNNLPVAPGASVNVQVGFTPTAAGARTATLTCNLTNGPAATFVTTLNGTAAAAAPIFATSTPANGNTISALGTAGTPLSRVVAFPNTGNAAGTMTCVATAGFTVNPVGAVNIAAGATGNISVIGTSAAPATLNGTLNCTGSEGSAFSFPLSFTFGAPSVAQIPAVGSFGLFAMLGLFAGLGMFFVFRNRA